MAAMTKDETDETGTSKTQLLALISPQSNLLRQKSECIPAMSRVWIHKDQDCKEPLQAKHNCWHSAHHKLTSDIRINTSTIQTLNTQRSRLQSHRCMQNTSDASQLSTNDPSQFYTLTALSSPQMTTPFFQLSTTDHFQFSVTDHSWFSATDHFWCLLALHKWPLSVLHIWQLSVLQNWPLSVLSALHKWPVSALHKWPFSVLHKWPLSSPQVTTLSSPQLANLLLVLSNQDQDCATNTSNKINHNHLIPKIRNFRSNPKSRVSS